jgi:hypothetical protein
MTIFYTLLSSFAENMKTVTKNKSSVTDDNPRSISSSREDISLVSEEFYEIKLTERINRRLQRIIHFLGVFTR